MLELVSKFVRLVRTGSLCALGCAMMMNFFFPAGSAAAAAGPRCEGKRATIVGTQGDDHIVGTPGNDVIVGLNGNDRIYGRGGNDRICGNRGADRIYGNRRGDRLDGGRGHDRIFGGRGSDSMHGDRGRDLVSGQKGNDQIIGHDGGNDDLRGGSGRNRLILSRARSSINVDLELGAMKGDASGRDRVTGFTIVYGTQYEDVIVGDDGDNYLFAGFDSGDDEIYGRGGDDIVEGHDGGDILMGEGGDDVISGGPEDRRIDGGEGRDRLDFCLSELCGQEDDPDQQGHIVDLSAGTLDGHSNLFNLEDIEGTDRRDTLIADDGPNRIWGGGGDDEIRALGGDDEVFGDAFARFAEDPDLSGDDTIDGGGGHDRADGGPGVDQCINVEEPINCEDQGNDLSRWGLPVVPVEVKNVGAHVIDVRTRSLDGSLCRERNSTHLLLARTWKPRVHTATMRGQKRVPTRPRPMRSAASTHCYPSDWMGI